MGTKSAKNLYHVEITCYIRGREEEIVREWETEGGVTRWNGGKEGGKGRREGEE